MLAPLLLLPTGWSSFGPMHPCLAEAATSVVAPGGSCVLSNISTGSYWAWPPGDVPLLLANATVAIGDASELVQMAVLQGIGVGNAGASAAVGAGGTAAR